MFCFDKALFQVILGLLLLYADWEKGGICLRVRACMCMCSWLKIIKICSSCAIEWKLQFPTGMNKVCCYCYSHSQTTQRKRKKGDGCTGQKFSHAQIYIFRHFELQGFFFNDFCFWCVCVLLLAWGVSGWEVVFFSDLEDILSFFLLFYKQNRTPLFTDHTEKRKEGR